jgi:hypothetical protein
VGDALKNGLHRGLALRHAALDLPSEGDWFLYWSDGTISRSQHLPTAFLRHLDAKDSASTIVRPSVALDGSWLILTSGGGLFRSSDFPDDVYEALNRGGTSQALTLFEFISDDPIGPLSGCPWISLYADGHDEVRHDDEGILSGAVARANAEGPLRDVLVTPSGGWMIIGNRTVQLSPNTSQSLRAQVRALERDGRAICQAVLGKEGRWALIVQNDGAERCPR